MKKIISAVIALVVGTALGALTLASPSYAVNSDSGGGSSSGSCSSASTCVQNGLTATGGTSSKTDINDLIKTTVNVLLFVIGAVSVIVIVIGGIRYVLSQGDSNSIASAKNTILYAVIGLIVALMAYAIVNFVVAHFV